MTQLTRELISSWLPDRPEDGHKGTFGKVLIVGGSVGYSGAPVLAARAAVRGGTGLVFVGVPKSLWPVAAAKLDEAMPFPLPEDGDGRLTYEAMTPILKRLSGCDAGLIGPGRRDLCQHHRKPRHGKGRQRRCALRIDPLPLRAGDGVGASGGSGSLDPRQSGRLRSGGEGLPGHDAL